MSNEDKTAAPAAAPAIAGAMPEHRPHDDQRASDGRKASGYNARQEGPAPRDDGQPNAAQRNKGTDRKPVTARSEFVPS